MSCHFIRCFIKWV